MRELSRPRDLGRILAPIAPALHRVEERLAAQVREFDPELQEYFRHTVGGQGKRLRPALALLSGQAAGKITDGHIELGVIVELIHIATLVHDDVMDGAQVRRNQPTIPARWGNEQAVLLGDCLFAHALKLAASFLTTEVCRCVADSANTVCTGEILQTRRRFDPTLTIEDYLRIIEMKTGTLFAVSCDLGAHLSGATVPQRSALREYGLALGGAYQIFDDCVDILGEESRAGKSLGTDLARGKLTLPILVCLQQTPEEERSILMDDLTRGGRGAGEVRQILDDHQAIEQSLETLERYLAKASGALETVGQTEASATLYQATEFMREQAYALAGTESPPVAVAGTR